VVHRRGILTIPAAGTGKDGQACPTTRDFALIGQDRAGRPNWWHNFMPGRRGHV